MKRGMRHHSRSPRVFPTEYKLLALVRIGPSQVCIWVVEAWPSLVLGSPRAEFGGVRDGLLTYSCRVRLARPSHL